MYLVGNPLKWRNIELNISTRADDPMWKELILWSNESLQEKPILNALNRNHSVLQPLSTEELENQTLKQFEMLKVR